jgi:general secretion pathway protein M
MISMPTIDRNLLRHISLPLATYAGLIVAFIFVTVLTLADLVGHYHLRNAASDSLTQLSQRLHPGSLKPGTSIDSWPPGSPVLEGQTATIASAALLQRITAVITRYGGTIASSEIEPQKERSKQGNITAVVICEIEQGALQKLLYEIEAGMPFLFIEALAVEAPTPPREGSRLKVRMGVSGIWSGAK